MFTPEDLSKYDLTKYRNFTGEMDATASSLSTSGFRANEAGLIEDLRNLALRGPHSVFATALERLRLYVRIGQGPDEYSNLLDIVGQRDRSPGVFLDQATAAKLAALKFLRHVYHFRLRDAQQIWIASVPLDFRSWPHEEILQKPWALSSLRSKINGLEERFSETDRTNLCTAAQDALYWSLTVMSKVGGLARGIGTADAESFVRRWFCDARSSADDVKRIAGELNTGFRRIAMAANSNRLIFTDHVSLRGTAWEALPQAFVLAMEARDREPVIYIEDDFFRPDHLSKLPSSRTNWALIVVHELCHLVLGFYDIKFGHRGIRPGHHLDPSEALKNPDSWSFFAADMVGQLPAASRDMALGPPPEITQKLPTPPTTAGARLSREPRAIGRGTVAALGPPSKIDGADARRTKGARP